MWRLAVFRIMKAIPAIFAIIAISFFLMKLTPGGPFDGERPLPSIVRDNLNRTYGLDKPLFEQFINYVQNLIRGDFGPSIYYPDFKVRELLARGLPVSALVGSIALILSVSFGMLIGLWAGICQGSWADRLINNLTSIWISVPTFVIAPLLSIVFAVWLGVLPAGGWVEGNLTYALLPAATLALPQAAVICRLTRNGTIEAKNSDSVLTARAYGLPKHRIILARLLRHASTPVASYLGPTVAGLLTGSMVVETLFGIPGIGRYFVQGALNRDYTLVMGTVVFVSVLIVITNLIADLLVCAIDPRARDR